MKTNKTKVLLILLNFTLMSTLSAQTGMDVPLTREPGKCYAKCYMSDTYEEIKEVYPIYIGDESPEENENLEKIVLVLSVAKTE